MAAQQKNLTLTFNPFSLAEIEGGMNAGAGIDVAKFKSIFLDATLILTNPFVNDEAKNKGSVTGYKLKPAFRYFTRQKDIPEGFFIEGEAMIKHVNYSRFDDVNVLDNNGNVAYIYGGGFNIIKNVYGANFKMGSRLYFSNAKHFGIDLFYGIGLRKKTYSTKNLPEGSDFRIDRILGFGLTPFWQNGTWISLPLGAKLIYRFK